MFLPTSNYSASTATAPYRRGSTVTFDRFIDGVLRSQSTPAMDQDAHSFKLQIDLPGVSREELSVDIEDNVVRIKTLEQAKRSYSVGYELPQEIDASVSLAKLENGVLYLTLAKKVPLSRATSLSIS